MHPQPHGTELATNDLDRLILLRRQLHRHPELSGSEHRTAAAVAEFLAATRPDEIVTGLGGHGVAVAYSGADTGPTLLLRAELDALPITEVTEVSYRSEHDGVGHQCGHDGHMTVLAGVGLLLGRRRPTRGRVVLLFQPSEENAVGAAAVLADPAFERLHPDLALALHNLTSLPLGQVVLDEGVVNCASRGVRVILDGEPTHASAPEGGVSPATAIARLLTSLPALGRGTEIDSDYRLVTVTHAALGERAFGVAPGHGEIWATLRTMTDDGMDALRADAGHLAVDVAEQEGLRVTVEEADVFHHCENHPAAVTLLRRALDHEGVPHTTGVVERGSEDFGRFRAVAPSAMFFIGSRRSADGPDLHHPDFDFPDQLIDTGTRVFARAVREFLD
ncbi:amidohydrolase [Plantibacter sp. T3]|uniref:amidohydrolase n=1 Tax=Plantibacter sp. T3 TaxID=2653161 RepID=UPI0012F45248|nr:amidohydrolase [Plantibacter sp. T3]VXB53773.1 Peptidase M20 [Plantibacter sp. T3]